MGVHEAEFARLKLQGDYLEPVTRRLIREAGIGPGMRVLDIGCGVGEVSRLLAEAVGPSGQVVAVDREDRVLDVARSRLPTEGHGPIEFVLASDEQMSALQPFDAAIGRYVLFHQADPVVMVRRAAAAVRSGGIVAFQEMVAYGETYTEPPLELWSRLADSAYAAVRGGFPCPSAGERLLAMLEEAGLRTATGFQERLTGDSESIIIPWLVMSYRSLLPTIDRLGLQRPEIGEIDTITDRLRAAARAAGTQFTSAPEACGWAIRP